MARTVRSHARSHLGAWEGVLLPPLLLGIVEHVYCLRSEAWDEAKCSRQLTEASGYPSAPRFAHEQMEAQPLRHCGGGCPDRALGLLWVWRPHLVKEAGSVSEATVGIQDVLSAGENEARRSRTGSERCSGLHCAGPDGGATEGQGRENKAFKDF